MQGAPADLQQANANQPTCSHRDFLSASSTVCLQHAAVLIMDHADCRADRLVKRCFLGLTAGYPPSRSHLETLSRQCGKHYTRKHPVLVKALGGAE